MFWTVFFAVLLAIYLIGCIAAAGIAITVLYRFKCREISDYKMAVICILLSWFSVGVKLCDDDFQKNHK